MKTILLPLELQSLIKFPLPRPFFETRSVSASSNINRDKMQTALFQSHDVSSKPFFAEIWETPEFLWIATGERSKGTLSTN